MQKENICTKCVHDKSHSTCAATKNKCFMCGKIGHFNTQCFSRKINCDLKQVKAAGLSGGLLKWITYKGDHMRLHSKHPAFSLKSNIGQTMAIVKGRNPRFCRGMRSPCSCITSHRIHIKLQHPGMSCLIFEFYFLVLHVTRKSHETLKPRVWKM